MGSTSACNSSSGRDIEVVVAVAQWLWWRCGCGGWAHAHTHQERGMRHGPSHHHHTTREGCMYGDIGGVEGAGTHARARGWRAQRTHTRTHPRACTRPGPFSFPLSPSAWYLLSCVLSSLLFTKRKGANNERCDTLVVDSNPSLWDTFV